MLCLKGLFSALQALARNKSPSWPVGAVTSRLHTNISPALLIVVLCIFESFPATIDPYETSCIMNLDRRLFLLSLFFQPFPPFSFFNRLTRGHKNIPKKVFSADIHLLFLFPGTILAQLEPSAIEACVNFCNSKSTVSSDWLITCKTQPIQRPSWCPNARFALRFSHTYFWTYFWEKMFKVAEKLEARWILEQVPSDVMRIESNAPQHVHLRSS